MEMHPLEWSWLPLPTGGGCQCGELLALEDVDPEAVSLLPSEPPKELLPPPRMKETADKAKTQTTPARLENWAGPRMRRVTAIATDVRTADRKSDE